MASVNSSALILSNQIIQAIFDIGITIVVSLTTRNEEFQEEEICDSEGSESGAPKEIHLYQFQFLKTAKDFSHSLQKPLLVFETEVGPIDTSRIRDIHFCEETDHIFEALLELLHQIE